MKKSKLKILVVDDEQHIVDFITMGLEMEGYEVICAYDGITGIELAKSLQPDLIILDVMLPGLNGFLVCEKIKESQDIPIIMLTAKDEVDHKVTGLNLGANDYMVKPFHFKELLARINVQLRTLNNNNNNNKGNTEKKFGDFEINDDSHELKYKGTLLTLSPTEYKLLHYLIINHELVISKSKILDDVWGHDFFGEENVVEVYIRYLRNKIGDVNHEVIKTVRGAGYRLVISNV
ncbi:MAG: response regulator transcription factor [Turicibacter sp.]